MIRLYAIFFVLLLGAYNVPDSRAGEVRIGLYYRSGIESLVFSPLEGEYMFLGDGRQVAVIRKGNILFIERTGSTFEVHDTVQSYGLFTRLEFKGVSKTNVFQVKPVFPALPPKESDDDLTIISDNDYTRLINSLELEKYIPGTVESEGGSTANPEYYKAQAVITRTFAIKNFHRHAHEGFNLCDGVHCQAFNGKSRMNREIYEAARQTEKEILTDIKGEPVMTAYHANCGGITGYASTVWNRDLNYLVPVKDPFCTNASHRNWSKTISMHDWNTYLKKKNFAGERQSITHMESGRQKYLDRDTKSLLLTDIRENFHLKSSYFYVEYSGNSVVMRGHGYGHGLGLCQQGAMEMARVGYTYVDILMFYFRGLLLKRDEGQGTRDED